jgi:hypothetical protein
MYTACVDPSSLFHFHHMAAGRIGPDPPGLNMDIDMDLTIELPSSLSISIPTLGTDLFQQLPICILQSCPNHPLNVLGLLQNCHAGKGFRNGRAENMGGTFGVFDRFRRFLRLGSILPRTVICLTLMLVESPCTKNGLDIRYRDNRFKSNYAFLLVLPVNARLPLALKMYTEECGSC